MLSPRFLCNMLPFQLTSFIVIFAATDPKNTTHHCWRQWFSGRRKPSLEQSATHLYICSDFRCLPEMAQNQSFFPYVLTLTQLYNIQWYSTYYFRPTTLMLCNVNTNKLKKDSAKAQYRPRRRKIGLCTMLLINVILCRSSWFFGMLSMNWISRDLCR